MYLFDLDGTLIDSRADLATAINATRVELGLQKVPQEVIIAHVGNGMKVLVRGAIPELAEDQIDEALAIQERHYGACLLNETFLYPGVKEALRTLAERGEKLGVVTNKPGCFSRTLLEGLGVAQYIGAVVGGGDCPELKPSPLPITYAAKILGCEVTSSDWLVGDNWTDLKAATQAGIRSCFCRFGFGVTRDFVPTVSVDSPEGWRAI